MKKYISIITIFFTVAIVGCKKDFLSLETNLNSPSVTTAQLSLTAAEKVAADIVNTSYSEYGVWGGYWTSSGNFVPSPQLQQYQFTNSDYTGVWTSLYANLANFDDIQTNLAAAKGLENFRAIAMIMKVYDFQQVVDNFNDAPYFQAFNSVSYPTPAYDPGATIYADLMVKLDAAIALIIANPGATNPTSSDIVYGGNMTNWEKFANTLKLRLAIRQSNKAAASTFKAELAKNPTLGYIDNTCSAIVNPGYQNLAGKESPFYGDYGIDQNGNTTANNGYYRANAYAVNFLSTTNDPRLQAFYAINGNGAYRGNIFGDIKNFLSNTNTSGVGPGLLMSPSQSAVLLSAAESDFLQAEGNLSGYIVNGSAQTFYQTGITDSFLAALGNVNVASVSSAAAASISAQAVAYYSQPVVNVSWTSSSANYQKAIITQKWVALNGFGNLEAYNEYRRTGFPVLPQSIDPGAVSSTLPTRIYYPLSELTTNGTSLGAEGTINVFTSKIFWAK